MPSTYTAVGMCFLQKAHSIFCLLCLFCFTFVSSSVFAAPPQQNKTTLLSASITRTSSNPFRVLACEIKSAITPAQVDLFDDVFAHAQNKHFDMVLVQLDTPGGVASSMREMVKQILNAPVPVAIWVGPSGAQAASAGVFLVAAADIAAMSPQTTLGSASPVTSSGGDLSKTMTKKVQNDFTSLLRGLAQRRGRNVKWYVSAVTKSQNVSATEAVMERIVDLLATSPPDLLDQLGRRGVMIQGQTVYFDDTNWTLDNYESGLRYQILSWLLDPQIAYFLLLGGIVGLFFELSTPGVILPGVFGGLCLLLALYAMSILPTSVTGILLILFAVILFVLELFITSFGLLSVTGLLGLFIGSLLLFQNEEGIAVIPLSTIIITVCGVAALLGVAIILTAKAFKSKSKTGQEGLLGAQASVRSVTGETGKVFVAGEIWNARFLTTGNISPGDRVRIVRVNGLFLEVEPENNTTSVPSA